jgi:hypothetical protein
MGFLDRLLGREERPTQYQQAQYQQAQYQQGQAAYGQQSYQQPQPRTDDQAAVERYRYLLRTAPPERIEEVHAEAFARLTPEQRRMVFDEMTRTAPAGEAPRADDPRSLAQSATRSEFRQPGFMERTLGANGGSGQRQGPGFGSMLGASILGTVAGYVIGSTLMSAFLPDPALDGGTDASSDSGDAGGTGSGDTASDGGSFEDAGWSDGGDFGGFGDFDV